MNAVYKLFSPQHAINVSPRLQETINALKTFSDKAYGHITYREEYDEVLRGNTEILFNVRDPRDIIMAEVHNAERKYEQGEKNHAWMNIDTGNGEVIFDDPNPIPYLIHVASVRWKYWLGWLDFPDVHLIRYEDIRLKPVETFIEHKDLFNRHGVGFEHFMKHIKPKKKNPTFISGRVGDWRAFFSKEEKVYAQNMLGSTIEKLGYEL